MSSTTIGRSGGDSAAITAKSSRAKGGIDRGPLAAPAASPVLVIH